MSSFGEIIVTIGALSVLWGALELLGIEEGGGWKIPALKVGGGLVVVGVGFLLKALGV
ncbi:MAG: hypothetical protein AAB725_01695 [Patescibacteria group bacterium]|mgnify:CR=1 FL=1